LLYTEAGGVEHVLTPKWTIARPWNMYLLGQEPTPRHVYVSLKPELNNYPLNQMLVPGVQDDLLKVYEPEFSAQIKIGILYCRKGQTTEQEMLSNREEDASPAYIEFLNLLGNKVTLQGFSGYSGGLDTLRNNAGTHSIYTQFMNSEIMFHVSTLLPFSALDAKQIERKKYIGNDRLVVVFKDDGEPFNPLSFKSKQTQAFVVVQPADETDPLVQTYLVDCGGRQRRDTEFDQDHISVHVSANQSYGGSIKSPRGERSDMSGMKSPRGGKGEVQEEKKDKHPAGAANFYKFGIATREEIPPCDPGVPEPPIFNHDQDFRTFLLRKITNSTVAMRYSTVFETKTAREKSVQFLSVLHKYAPNPKEDAANKEKAPKENKV